MTSLLVLGLVWLISAALLVVVMGRAIRGAEEQAAEAEDPEGTRRRFRRSSGRTLAIPDAAEFAAWYGWPDRELPPAGEPPVPPDDPRPGPRG
ncbi:MULTISPECIES: hypothetical protein [unclassified Blastococcus]